MLSIVRPSLAESLCPASHTVGVSRVHVDERGFARRVRICDLVPVSLFSATASLPASDELHVFPRWVLFCDSNCFYCKSVQEAVPASPREPGGDQPVSHPISLSEEKKSMCLDSTSQVGRCSLLALFCLAWYHSQAGARGTSLRQVSCQRPAWQSCLPLPGPHGNLALTRVKFLSFTASERKNDTGAGAVSQPQPPSSPLAKAQKHFLIGGAHLLPRSIHSWRMATACVALTVVHSQPAERPWPEQPIAAATWPRGSTQSTACT